MKSIVIGLLLLTALLSANGQSSPQRDQKPKEEPPRLMPKEDPSKNVSGGGGMSDPNKSIAECIQNIDKLSLLNTALARPELKSVLEKLNSKEGEYTFFAPVNDAIREILQTANTTTANQTFTEQDKEALMVAGIHYHIVPKKLVTKDMKPLELPKTLLNDSKWVNLPNNKPQRLHLMDESGNKKYQIWFGLDKDHRPKKANFLVSDIMCSNGVIHLIDKVVEIPMETSKILNDSGLTKFVEFAKKNGLQDRMDKTPGVTVFAPLNSAFDNLKFDDDDKDTKDKKDSNDTRGSRDSKQVKDSKGKDDKDDKGDKDEKKNKLKNILNNLIQEGLFYIKYDSQGPIKFQKPGDKDDDKEKDKDQKTNQTGQATGQGQTTGIRKLLQALTTSNASATGATGATGTGQRTGAQTATGTGVGLERQNATTWKLCGDFNNWDIDGVTIIAHDVLTQNGVVHVVDNILGMPKPKMMKSNASFTCEDMKCPSGDECCDVSIDSINEITPRCFNPKTHVCSSRGNMLCGKDAPLACGLHCYNKDKYVCHNGVFLCPKSAPLLCGISCYQGDQFKCVEGSLRVVGEVAAVKERQKC